MIMSTRLRACLLACLATALPSLAAATCQLPRVTPTSDFVLSPAGWAIHRPSGLMWSRCDLGGVYSAASNQCSAFQPLGWAAALNGVAALNSGPGYAGFRDWRLPTVKELTSLVDYCGYAAPALNTEVFPLPANDLAARRFWSSTPLLRSDGLPAHAFVVQFSAGGTLERPIGEAHVVRLVRDATGTP